ncbi:hypothetical protein HispidOSU_000097, partial [Sigmodon hispidus]
AVGCYLEWLGWGDVGFAFIVRSVSIEPDVAGNYGNRRTEWLSSEKRRQVETDERILPCFQSPTRYLLQLPAKMRVGTFGRSTLEVLATEDPESFRVAGSPIESLERWPEWWMKMLVPMGQERPLDAAPGSS